MEEKEKDYPTWIYNKKGESKIIKMSEFKKYKAEGWEDTPAKFKKKEK